MEGGGILLRQEMAAAGRAIKEFPVHEVEGRGGGAGGGVAAD